MFGSISKSKTKDTSTTDPFNDTSVLDFWADSLASYSSHQSNDRLQDPLAQKLEQSQKLHEAKDAAECADQNARDEPLEVAEEDPTETTQNTTHFDPTQATIPSSQPSHPHQQTHTDTSAAHAAYDHAYPHDAYQDWSHSTPAYPQPASFIPPAPPAFGSYSESDPLTNLIMAWYYSGYYTGLYQAQNTRQ
ncbi:hypothetical protein DM01DRAFT_1409660 [Hesseltinella vesiculosa]|uniref:Uncharacterized protein n=1 Tax=Hesseltinella vesiculosa TaxID=101127 RepID=A0A1X2G9Q4_9FUNG|nr:hypothetical protein DM01DRAFT_1409660 [Hesseltinella vesiculosa]